MDNRTEGRGEAVLWPWEAVMPRERWLIYRPVLQLAQARNIVYAMGGGFAFSFYTHRWRPTKDIDLYVEPQSRDMMVETLAEAGFVDYFDEEPYDRQWIYRGIKDGMILDIIWQMVNGRAVVDGDWLLAGPLLELADFSCRLVPAEEFLWAKLYVVQRDRCDWPDLLNVLYMQGPELNWDRLLVRIGDDKGLLGSLLGLFSWLCPERSRDFPQDLWPRMGVLFEAPSGPLKECCRAELLDSRDWFGPMEECS